MKNFISEFKTFAMKGNVMELAVAVVIGAAFGKIVSSLVEHIITPLIGLLMGGVNVSGLSATIGKASVQYGQFIQSVIDFLIVALVIFLVVKTINHAKEVLVGSPESKTEAKSVEVSEEVKLLREIRDALKQ
jgi:large conductance mechanosensitive channel